MELDARELRHVDLPLVDLPPAASRRWRDGTGLQTAAALMADLKARHLATIAAIVVLIALVATEPPF